MTSSSLYLRDNLSNYCLFMLLLCKSWPMHLVRGLRKMILPWEAIQCHRLSYTKTGGAWSWTMSSWIRAVQIKPGSGLRSTSPPAKYYLPSYVQSMHMIYFHKLSQRTAIHSRATDLNMVGLDYTVSRLDPYLSFVFYIVLQSLSCRYARSYVRTCIRGRSHGSELLVRTTYMDIVTNKLIRSVINTEVPHDKHNYVTAHSSQTFSSSRIVEP
jgi:hypothetical protein